MIKKGDKEIIRQSEIGIHVWNKRGYRFKRGGKLYGKGDEMEIKGIKMS
jgi:hypothetical protein